VKFSRGAEKMEHDNQRNGVSIHASAGVKALKAILAAAFGTAVVGTGLYTVAPPPDSGVLARAELEQCERSEDGLAEALLDAEAALSRIPACKSAALQSGYFFHNYDSARGIR
jgi:hypothetical protein